MKVKKLMGYRVALIIDIKVFPQSGKHALVIDKSGLLKVYVKAAPEDGKANKEVIQLIAEICDVSKKDVEIIYGLVSRKKRLAIQTLLSYEQLLMRISGGVQKTIF